MSKRKRKKAISTLHRSMELMRDEGYKVGKTEQFNKFVNIRVDLFHFIDALAMDTTELVAVQSTSIKHVADHLGKIATIPEVSIWLAGPGRRLEVHGWGIQGDRGERKLRVVRRIDVTAQLLKEYEKSGVAI